MADRSYLPIGQVLDLLKREFPDLTISKIRFLESQGLLDPERTPSGYRKFYGADIERLRFILREQADHYLPLKVIKGRLGMDPDAEPALHPGPDADLADDDGARGPGPTGTAAPGLLRPAGANIEEGSSARTIIAPTAADPLARRQRSLVSGADVDRPETASPETGRTRAERFRADRTQAERPQAERPLAERRHADRGEADDRQAQDRQAQDRRPLDRPSQDRKAQGGAVPSSLRQRGSDQERIDDDPDDPVSVTLEELASKSGLSVAQVTELERFGLIAGRKIVGTTYYDADSLEIANLAATFRAFGVEARHLRMYRTAVEREAGFFEQVITPMLKQRNPQARRQATDTLVELSRLGQAMRAAMVRQALREYTGPG